jgi:hypothetical protein
MLLIDLGLGPYADQRIDHWQESFVPDTLADVVATSADANGSSRALAAPAVELAHGVVAEAPALPPDLRWPFLLLGLALALLLHWLAAGGHLRRSALALFASVFELACGLGGLVLLFLWLATEHRAAWRNENLLLLNPLCLALVPAWFGRLRDRPRARAIAWVVVAIAAVALFSKILPGIVQANLHWIVLFLPIHVALALALRARRVR